MVRIKPSTLLIISSLLVRTEIVLVGSGEYPERHGDITISSTINRPKQPAKLERHIPYANTSSIHYEKKIYPRKEKTHYINVKYAPTYTLSQEVPLPIEPIYTHRVNYIPQDQRIKDLLEEIRKTKKDQEAVESSLEKLKEKTNHLKILSAEQRKTDASINSIQERVQTLKSTLDILKSKISFLSVRSIEQTQQIKSTQREIETLERTLQTKTNLIHRLHHLKKKYKWIQSEYNYYEESSDYNPIT